MKILTFIAALVAVLLCFSSCTPANTPSETTDEITTDEITTDEITTEEDPPTTEKYYCTRPGETDPVVLENFDLTLSHKPTVSDILSLLSSMNLKKGFWFEEEVPIPEIIARFGKPHNFGTGSLYPSFIWYTEEGMYLCVTFYHPDEKCPTDIDPLQWYLEGGMAFKIAMFYNQEDSPQPIPSYLFEK